MSNIAIPLEEAVVQIKERVCLIDYIEKHQKNIQVRRTGNYYRCQCPFHEDKSPSFIIYPETNSYYCWGCGKGGTIIDYLMTKDNLKFKEACAMAAEEIGLEYYDVPPNPIHEEYKELMLEHARRYYKNLQTDTNIAKDYLYGRGITDESIKEFRLGYVPVEEYKIRKDIGGICGRLSFPIMENKDISKAKFLGMGYRTLQPAEPKYINDKTISNTSDPLYNVFVKGNCLYGYAQAIKHIKPETGVYVVEGYLDVIAMHQSGFKNTVGTMGTAFTDTQMNILRKITSNITIFADGDNAGRSRVIRSLPELLKKGFNVKHIESPSGEDPADVCKRLNFDVSEMMIFFANNTKHTVADIINNSLNKYEEFMIEERKKVLNNLSDIINSIQDDYDRVIYKDLIYKRLDIKGGI